MTLLKQLSKFISYDVYHFLLPIHFTLTQKMNFTWKELIINYINKIYKDIINKNDY